MDMKKLFGIFAAIVLVPTFSAQAWIGGPFSGNSYSANGDDGIYEAVATLSNGLGMFRWAVNNNNAGGVTSAGNLGAFQTSNVMFGGLIGAVNPHVWYYKGLVYYGRCFGTVNSMMGSDCDGGLVTCIGNAAVNGLDGSGNSLNGVNLASGGTAPSSGSSVTPTTSLFGLGNNKGWANSEFVARITSKKPVKRFSGSGTVSFIGIADVSYETYDVTLDIDVDGDGTDDGTIDTVHNELHGDDSAFSQFGHRRNFKVFGTQVSYQVNS